MSLRYCVPMAALYRMQILTSSEGSNGKMSAKGKKKIDLQFLVNTATEGIIITQEHNTLDIRPWT